MFRPMRRTKRAISNEDAKRLLEQGRRAVLAVNGDDGCPFAFPINYRFDADANKIFSHGAKAGQKVDALRRSDKVCLTVMGNEHYEQGEWAPYVQSAAVFGARLGSARLGSARDNWTEQPTNTAGQACLLAASPLA